MRRSLESYNQWLWKIRQRATTIVSALGIGTSSITWTAVQTFSFGIIFANETLDTYDQVTFTPAWSLGGGTVDTYGSQLGHAIRIGNIYFYCGYLDVATTPTPSGEATLTGLPITNGTGNGHLTPMTVYPQGFGATLTTQYMGRLASNATTCVIRKQAATGGITSTIGGDFANGCAINFSGLAILV